MRTIGGRSMIVVSKPRHQYGTYGERRDDHAEDVYSTLMLTLSNVGADSTVDTASQIVC